MVERREAVFKVSAKLRVARAAARLPQRGWRLERAQLREHLLARQRQLRDLMRALRIAEDERRKEPGESRPAFTTMLELSCAGIGCHADIRACLAWGEPVRSRLE